MGDDNIHDNSATNYSAELLLYQTEMANIEYGQRVSITKDTTGVSDGVQVKLGVYTSLPGNPKLTNPSSDNTPGGFDHINNLLQNFPDQVLTFFNSLPSVEGDKFPEELDQKIAEIPEDTLAKIGGGDAQKGAAMLRFAVLHPDAKMTLPSNPDMSASQFAAFVTVLRDNVTGQVGHGPSALLVSVEDAAMNGLSQFNFQGAVLALGLSDADQKAVFFANSVPSAAALLSPALQAALKSAQSAAAAKTEGATGCPPGWLTPPNGKDLETLIGNTLVTNVTNSLSQELMDGKITKAQYNEMRTLFFSPDSDTPNKATLLPMLNSIIGQETQGLQKIYGFPDSYSPEIEAAGYNGVLNCTFSANFNTLLGKQTPPLTADQQTQLQQALLSSTSEAALPDDLKTIFENLKGAAIAQLSKTYGVPLTWTPDAAVLSTAAAKSTDPGIVQAQIALNQGKEWLSYAKQAYADYSASMPAAAGGGGGPDPSTGILIKDYMKTVALALQGMQEMLYELSTTDSSMAAMMNKVQNDSKIGQLKKQAAQLQKTIDQQKKMDSLGPLKAIFQWLIMLILIMFLGPVGYAIAMVLMVCMVVQSAKQLSEGKSFGSVMANMNFIDDLSATLKDIGNAIGGPFGQFFAHLATIVTLIVMCVVCPELLVMDLMLGSGSIVKDLLEAFGVPPKAAEMAAMIIQIIAQVVIGIALAIVTGGATIAVAIVNFAKTVTEVTLEVVKMVLQFVADMCVKLLGLAAEDGASIAGEQAGTLTNRALGALEDFSTACDKTVEGLQKVEKLASKVEDAMENVEDATKDLETCQQAVDEATSALDKDPENTFLQAALERVKGSYSSAEEALDVAESGVKDAKDAFEEADGAAHMMQQKMTSYIEEAHTVTDAVNQVAQAIPAIQNDIIQAQITRIKANLDAEMVNIEQFCKLLIALVQKLMDTVSSAGQDIKDISDSLANLFQTSEGVLSNLAGARG